MFQKDVIGAFIRQGVEFLGTQQEEGGNFIGLSFSGLTDLAVVRYESTFLTSLILDSLNGLEEDAQVGQIKKKAASFLLTQKSPHWSFNYWVRDSKEAQEKPYPDDLDDTFCALSSLFRYDPSLIDGEAMAGFVALLTAAEVKEGGPYRTWLVGEGSAKKWRDVDVAVNSNIAYFLSLTDITLPRLISFIERNISKDTLTSPYYPSIYPIIYFISRFYKGKHTDKLRKLLLSKRDEDHAWGNPLQTAIVVSSLLNFGTSPSELSASITYLMLNRDGSSWSPYAFCTDPTREGKTFYAGSAALTTAFCLEALGKFLKADGLVDGSKSQDKVKEDRLHAEIIQKAGLTFSVFDSKLNKRALSLLNKLVVNDSSGQIALMPYFFAQTLGDKKKNISYDLIVKLGVVNVLGWIAYTIYDDFLDEEGEPVMLPLANVALRELTCMFESLFPANAEFRAFFHTIMDHMDGANAWEVSTCRMKVVDGSVVVKDIKIPQFGTYEKIAYKSLGHSLGPLAILSYLGYSWNSPEVRNMLDFFKHYLIVKQLHDDAHDWEEDLKRGQINPVGALLLKKIYPTHIKGKVKISLLKLMPHLQKLFWYETIDQICGIISKDVKKARKNLKKCHPIVDPVLLENLLAKYEKAAQEALREKDQAVKFLKFYNNK